MPLYIAAVAVFRAFWDNLWAAIEAHETRIATDGLSVADAEYMMRHFGETLEDVGEADAHEPPAAPVDPLNNLPADRP